MVTSIIHCPKCNERILIDDYISQEVAGIIGIRPGENYQIAIQRYVRETKEVYERLESRCEAAEQELKRLRKLARKMIGE